MNAEKVPVMLRRGRVFHAEDACVCVCVCAAVPTGTADTGHQVLGSCYVLGVLSSACHTDGVGAGAKALRQEVAWLVEEQQTCDRDMVTWCSRGGRAGDEGPHQDGSSCPWLRVTV